MKDLQKDEPGFLASTFSPFYPRLLGIFLKVVKKKKITIYLVSKYIFLMHDVCYWLKLQREPLNSEPNVN